ncbi:FecR family protein [Barnesiella intestinihominis]|jgi:ferric-dicitrate binding protein FerR (iron transport regulator)
MGDRIVPLYSLTVPAGNSNTLLLPDGTKVWLNAGSTIKYPSSFLGMQRNIEIEGEAYLEVAHNRWKPFIVNTPNGKVKVLGTKFYVTSTLKEKDFMVSLIEGSVKISSGEKSAMLKPGYRAQFKDGEFKQSVIRTFETELWKDGIYYFKDKSFDELMEGFEKCFGVKISIDKDIKSTEHYTGKFYRYNGIQHALQALQHDFNFDFKWDKELNTIQITSKHK